MTIGDMRSLESRIEKLESRTRVGKRVIFDCVHWDGKAPLPPQEDNVIRLIVREAGQTRHSVVQDRKAMVQPGGIR